MSHINVIIHTEYRGMYEKTHLTPRSSRRMMDYRGILDEGLNDEELVSSGERSPAYNVCTRVLSSDGVITTNFNINTLFSNTDSSQGCCSSCYYGIQRIRSCCGQMCCISKTNRLCKIAVCWVILIAISTLLALSVRYSIFGTSYRQELSRGDQYLIPDHLAPTFCKSAMLESDAHFEAYLLDKHPEVDVDFMRSYQVLGNLTLRGNWYKVLEFNLLQQSTVDTHVCPQKEMELYILRGQENFDEWKLHRMCSNCYIKYGHLVEVPVGECHDHHQVYKIIADQTDDYFFVFNRPFKDDSPTDDTTLFIKQLFNRTTYNMESIVKQNCTHVKQCQLDFDVFSKQHIVLENMYPSRWSQNHNITISCKPRLVTYGVVFVLLPLLICVFYTAVVFVKCKDPEHRPIIEGATIRDYSTSVTASCESNFSSPSTSESDEHHLVAAMEHSLPKELSNHI